MDFSNRFSLVDFLAYLFPGIVGTLGLYILLLLTPLQDPLRRFPTGLTTGVLFLTVSFILGVIFSGFSELAVKRRRSKIREELKSSMPLTCFEKDLARAFQDIFHLPPDSEVRWSRDHIYVCRSLVVEKMPNCAQLIQRQNGLRQLRMNLIFPLLIWFFAGLAWGMHQISNQRPFWGSILIALSVALVPPTFSVIINRMDGNERRETREVLSAFLAGYKTGIFAKHDRDK
jgi:hypothetical protein